MTGFDPAAFRAEQRRPERREHDMSETDRDGKDRRHARIGALTDSQRWELLAYLCGRAPELVDTSLDQMEGDWRRWHAAAQVSVCGDHHASGVTSCTRDAGHDGAHHNGSGLTWGSEHDAAQATEGSND